MQTSSPLGGNTLVMSKDTNVMGTMGQQQWQQA